MLIKFSITVKIWNFRFTWDAEWNEMDFVLAYWAILGKY